MSRNNHTPKSSHALLRGLGTPARESSIRIRVYRRNLIQSLSVNCRSQLRGGTVAQIKDNLPLLLETHAYEQFLVLPRIRRLHPRRSSIVRRPFPVLQTQTGLVVKSLPELVEHLEPVILWRIVAGRDHYPGRSLQRSRLVSKRWRRNQTIVENPRTILKCS